jgi:hypothetical protein
LKQHLRTLQRFANLVNRLARRVAEELRCLMDMDHSSGSKQSAAGGIGGDRIISQNNAPERPWLSVEWTISFHRHDASAITKWTATVARRPGAFRQPLRLQSGFLPVFASARLIPPFLVAPWM